MKWKKIGKIFEPNNNFPWMVSHASCPLIEFLDNKTLIIYFSSRDNNNKSFTCALQYSLTKNKLLEIYKKPILTPGTVGSFDEDGAMLSCIVQFNNQNYYYYIGWNKAVSVPFRNSIGLAVRKNNKIKKIFQGPIMDRSIYDPCFIGSCWVLNDNNKLNMWYLSCFKWEANNNLYKHFYHIKYAYSYDAINWIRNGIVCIDYISKYEYAISRPCVIKDNNIFKMWYSFRAQKHIDTYRIGYAESNDGINWIRKDDEAGIDVSSSGWDSQMICYPYIFDHGGNRYMLYNGNGYGKTGFGLAILEQD